MTPSASTTWAGLEAIKQHLRLVLNGRNRPNCIVWVDEGEKALAGQNDLTGITSDQIGVLLQYMEDRRARGFILFGHPGVGKSMIAKAAGPEVGRPTVMCDLGAMMGSLVGQSQQAVRNAVKVIDAHQRRQGVVDSDLQPDRRVAARTPGPVHVAARTSSVCPRRKNGPASGRFRRPLTALPTTPPTWTSTAPVGSAATSAIAATPLGTRASRSERHPASSIPSAAVATRTSRTANSKQTASSWTLPIPVSTSAASRGSRLSAPSLAAGSPFSIEPPFAVACRSEVRARAAFRQNQFGKRRRFRLHVSLHRQESSHDPNRSTLRKPTSPPTRPAAPTSTSPNASGRRPPPSVCGEASGA